MDRLSGYVDMYVELDARIGVKLSKNLDLEISGRNLLNENHSEFLSIGSVPREQGENIEVSRSFSGKITCRF